MKCWHIFTCHKRGKVLKKLWCCASGSITLEASASEYLYSGQFPFTCKSLGYCYLHFISKSCGSPHSVYEPCLRPWLHFIWSVILKCKSASASHWLEDSFFSVHQRLRLWAELVLILVVNSWSSKNLFLFALLVLGFHRSVSDMNKLL